MPGGANIALLDSMVRWCLGRGYHVVLEGIMAGRYGEMLNGLRRDHQASHWFISISRSKRLSVDTGHAPSGTNSRPSKWPSGTRNATCCPAATRR
jgi:hypothetical protein